MILSRMLYYYALPIAVGVMVVLQGGTNRKIGSLWGLSTAVLINASLLFALSAIFFGILRWSPDTFPAFLRPRTSPETPGWWCLLPGFCGFCIVVGLPWSIQTLGAGKSFILVITAQICAGLIWDFVSVGVAPSLWKVLGAGLTLLGSLFVIFG
jgi:uncharacterized membrane protein YdcZ (DUF606 family)